MSVTDTEAAAYDQRVAELDDDAFDRAAAAISHALRVGGGLRMWFQPGDATRYLVEVGRRHTLTVSNGEEDRVHMDHVANVAVTFGTEDDRQTFPIGHVSRLRPLHGWTAAVWRRLWDEVTTYPQEHAS